MRAYGIKPKVIRVGGATPRGYRKEDFTDAWLRYLPPHPLDERNKRKHRNNIDAMVLGLLHLLRLLRFCGVVGGGAYLLTTEKRAISISRLGLPMLFKLSSSCFFAAPLIASCEIA